MSAINEHEPLFFPQPDEIVDAARLAQIHLKLNQAELQDFADVEVVSRKRRGALALLLTLCPPEHLEDPVKFETDVMVLLAVAPESP